jgi:hypothetical protein
MDGSRLPDPGAVLSSGRHSVTVAPELPPTLLGKVQKFRQMVPAAAGDGAGASKSGGMLPRPALSSREEV